MGTLYYSSASTPVQIEDTLLAHLKVVMATKLRRGESFTLAWQHDENSPAGRTTLWLEPSIPLRFVFDDADPAVLDPRRMQSMADEVARTGAITLPPLHTPRPERTRQVAGSGPRRHRGAVTADAAASAR
ncbi:hypothetical protein [Microbacterium sp. zg-YB36]|uniref:DUF7882 family protein n=1 Tax=Microbacterium sp. zg-YB36 TaxID=2969407 RepID=UPI00214BB4F2|nr:hypothetical protein [Microbacterium sp. zg-YB36]MDL5351677.1 hypothetical protein [Microbacterium sp. zg-YB36]